MKVPSIRESATIILLSLIGILTVMNSFLLDKVLFEQARVKEVIESNQQISEINFDSIFHRVGVLEVQMDTLQKIHPWKQWQKKWGSNICKSGTFLGFLLYTPVDTSIAPKFRDALASYTGPAVKVNSLVRKWSIKSDHWSGKAADLELSKDLINFLLSDKGHRWLEDNDLYFYIEGRPGSAPVGKYLKSANTAPFVFFNPDATGNHIHLGCNS